MLKLVVGRVVLGVVVFVVLVVVFVVFVVVVGVVEMASCRESCCLSNFFSSCCCCRCCCCCLSCGCCSSCSFKTRSLSSFFSSVSATGGVFTACFKAPSCSKGKDLIVLYVGISTEKNNH